MKKNFFAFVVVILVFSSGVINAQKNIDIEKNKKVATLYHELNPEDIDGILAEDFIGRTNSSKWNREDHRKFWSNNKGENKILHLIAEGDLVAIRFMRTMEWNGKMIKFEAMQFMQFENGKIVEIWENFDSGLFETEEE
jgi:predicted ester cyclase